MSVGQDNLYRQFLFVRWELGNILGGKSNEMTLKYRYEKVGMPYINITGINVIYLVRVLHPEW